MDRRSQQAPQRAATEALRHHRTTVVWCQVEQTETHKTLRKWTFPGGAVSGRSAPFCRIEGAALAKIFFDEIFAILFSSVDASRLRRTRSLSCDDVWHLASRPGDPIKPQACGAASNFAGDSHLAVGPTPGDAHELRETVLDRGSGLPGRRLTAVSRRSGRCRTD